MISGSSYPWASATAKYWTVEQLLSNWISIEPSLALEAWWVWKFLPKILLIVYEQS